MSNFNCEHCGTAIMDSPSGYVTGCEHYPVHRQPVPCPDCGKPMRDGGYVGFYCINDDCNPFKTTATVTESGKVLSVECEGVSSPVGYDFKSVNDWVHSVGRHYEELQWHALGAANAYDALMAEVKQLREGMRVLKIHALDMGNDVEIPAPIFNLVMDGDLTPPLDP